MTRPTTVSIMSEQAGHSFTPFRTSNGKSLNMLAMGTVAASDMIARAEAENTAWTWGLRVAGFVMMGIGLGLVLKPLSVLADVLPIAGDFVQTGTGLISFCVAGACSLATISVAWVFYRPLIGVPLLLAGVGLFSALVYFLLKARAARSTAPAAKSVEFAPDSTSEPVGELVGEPASEPAEADEPVSIEDIDEAISI